MGKPRRGQRLVKARSNQNIDRGSGDSDLMKPFEQNGKDEGVGDGARFVTDGDGHGSGRPKILQFAIAERMAETLLNFLDWIFCRSG